MPDELRVEPLDFPRLRQWPEPPGPCPCDVFAVRRPGINETPGIQGVRLARLGGGGVVLPPLASLYLAPGSYVVSAKVSIARNVANSGLVFVMLGTPGQGNLSWTWLRMPASFSPGDSQVVNLLCVVTLAPADRPADRVVVLDAYGGNADYEFLAYDIWLTAQEVGTATVQKV
jgi:hypothetical protein